MKAARQIVEQPLYSDADVARLAGLSRRIARRWIEGYSSANAAGETVSHGPVTLLTARPPDGASFLDLVELLVIRRFKELGFSLPAIRRVVDDCQHAFGVQHPLVTMQFKTGGRDIFVSYEGELVDVLRRRGAMAWNDVLAPFLATLDYEDDMARRWWPLGRHEPIVVDPAIGFGQPVVTTAGVRTEIVVEHFRAGDSAAQIASDFNLTPAWVEQALRFEICMAA